MNFFRLNALYLFLLEVLCGCLSLAFSAKWQLGNLPLTENRSVGVTPTSRLREGTHFIASASGRRKHHATADVTLNRGRISWGLGVLDPENMWERQSMFDPQNVTFFRSKLLSDNSACFTSSRMKDLCQKWKVRLLFQGAYRLSGTGIVECLEIIDVGCNLKQFDGLT